MLRGSRLSGVVLLSLLVCASGSGCVYSKQVTNERIRSLETSRIVVGETTVLEVLEEWGPPAPVDVNGLLPPVRRNLYSLDATMLRYVSRELKCNSFLAAAPIIGAPVPIMPRLPFVWCDDQSSYVIVLEFDAEGVVKRVSKGTTEVVWRPWSSGDGRKVEVQTTARRGMSLP